MTWLGKKRPYVKEARKKQGLVIKGSKNPNWKGEKVGYSGIHRWIFRNLGRPSICRNCAKKDGRLHWANKNHKYSRDANDWVMLCPSCHKKFDLGIIKI